jgi:hypothetical protein
MSERGKLAVSGPHVMRFIQTCATLEECQRAIPELTRAQFDAIRAGRAVIEGSSEIDGPGLEYREL